MADKPGNAKDKKEEGDEAKPKGKLLAILTKPLVLIVGIFFILTMGLMFTMVLLFESGPTTTVVEAAPAQVAQAPAHGAEKEKEKPEPEKTSHSKKEESKDSKPQFYKFKPSFVVNVPDRGQIRYLQVDVELMTRNPKMIENIEAYAPLIRNDLITLFSSQNYEDLVSVEGKELLRTKSLEIVQKIMKENVGENAVDQVLFTNFVTQ
jgi:flagellar FliL protein